MGKGCGIQQYLDNGESTFDEGEIVNREVERKAPAAV
jgi:hypothetical protein